MEVKFENQELSYLYEEAKAKGKPRFPREVILKFIKTVKLIILAENLNQLKSFKGLNFEPLKGNLKGKYSVRVDIKYRLILRVEKNELIIEDVIVIEDLTNHYD